MNTIKILRKKTGYTQVELAQKTGLSLRTIQRLENGIKSPKGHSLKVLCEVFGVERSVLQNIDREDSQEDAYKFVQRDEQNKEADKLSLLLINASSLAVLGIPFGNLIVPFVVWNKRRNSKTVDEKGRRIINFQILWSITLCFSLCISPFISKSLFFSIPLILVVLFSAIAINIVVICKTAVMIQRDETNFLNLPIRLI